MTTAIPRPTSAPGERPLAAAPIRRRLPTAGTAQQLADTARFVQRLPATLGYPATAVIHTAATVAVLPGRVLGLVTLAEQTLTAVHAAVARSSQLLDRIEAATSTAEHVTRTAAQAATVAVATVEHANVLTTQAIALVDGYSASLAHLQPTLRRLAESTQPAALDALATLLDRLPQLADAVDDGLLPLLGHLNRVSPDIDQLLDSVARLNHVTSRLPAVFRRHHPGP
jgi:hypothetical protein